MSYIYGKIRPNDIEHINPKQLASDLLRKMKNLKTQDEISDYKIEMLSKKANEIVDKVNLLDMKLEGLIEALTIIKHK